MDSGRTFQGDIGDGNPVGNLGFARTGRRTVTDTRQPTPPLDPPLQFEDEDLTRSFSEMRTKDEWDHRWKRASNETETRPIRRETR